MALEEQMEGFTEAKRGGEDRGQNSGVVLQRCVCIKSKQWSEVCH